MGCVVSCLSVLQNAELYTIILVFMFFVCVIHIGYCRYHVISERPSPKIESKWAIISFEVFS